MDLAIYAYGISIGFISTLLALIATKYLLKKSIPLPWRWVYIGILSLILGSVIGGIYFIWDVGTVPGVENPVRLAILFSSISGVFFSLLLGIFRGIFYLLFQKKN